MDSEFFSFQIQFDLKVKKKQITTNINTYLLEGCGRCKLAATPACKVVKWRAELMELRDIALASKLTEEVKWGVPCYTWNGANVFLLHAFKEYCAILFMKGSLLKDPKKILIQQTENVQGGRQIRFTNLKEIVQLKKVLSSYIQEAIELEKRGEKVVMKQTSEFKVPDEFTEITKKDLAFKKAFDALTPGRQRGYLLFFSQAKQSKTRIDRITKYRAQILKGKGLQDR